MTEPMPAQELPSDRIDHYTKVPTSDTERQFVIFIVSSIVFHLLFVLLMRRIDISEEKPPTIDQMPQRIARLIMDKPKPKEKPKPIAAQTVKTEKLESTAERSEAAVTSTENSESSGDEGAEPKNYTAAERKVAQAQVAKAAVRVERELRSTGMLALLTGAGPSKFRGRAAVDILGGQSVKGADLDAALKGVTGVARAGSEADLGPKLTSRRVIETEEKVSISDMVKGFGSASKQLEKLGTIQINKPKTIGAAPQSASRDETAIAEFVKKNIRSINAEFDRLLKINPGLSGKITVRFTILPDGHVTDVEIVDSSIEEESLKTKMVRVISNWVFPSIGEGEGNLTVNFPFVFQPNN